MVAPNTYAFQQLGKQLVALWETSCRCQKWAEGEKSSLNDHMYIKMCWCLNRDPVKIENNRRWAAQEPVVFLLEETKLFFVLICLGCREFYKCKARRGLLGHCVQSSAITCAKRSLGESKDHYAIHTRDHRVLPLQNLRAIVRDGQS